MRYLMLGLSASNTLKLQALSFGQVLYTQSDCSIPVSADTSKRMYMFF